MAAAGNDEEELKKKLVRRIGIAGVLIAVLLGGLALLEDWLLEKPPAPPPAPAAPAPVEARPDAPKEEAKEEAKEEVKAEPERTATPLAPPSAPETKPVQRVVIKPPAAVPGPPQQKQAAAARTERAEVPASPEAKPDPATLIARGYRLQMGVFSQAGNAEELRAKLEQAGIPAYIESRVQVGPFKTQQEADAARRKLKELGLGPGLLIPPQKR